MSQLKARCIDQVLTFENTPIITSGDVNYDSVLFEFCSRWDGFTKTAIFYRSEDEVYYQLLDKANTCLIPNEVLTEKGDIFIGVFGVKEDTTLTSQVLKYKITKGAITENLKPSDPTPDIYAQLISGYNHYDERLAYFEERFNGSVGDAEKLGGHEAEYYAPLEDIGYFEKTKLVSSTVTKIESLAQGVYRIFSANASITDFPSDVNKDTSVGHFLIVMCQDNAQKTYILTEPLTNKVWFGKTYGISNGIEWDSPFTTKGGTVNGTVRAVSDKAEAIWLVVGNSLRKFSLGVRADGSGCLYDDTANDTIIDLPADLSKTRRFVGVASGNVPLDGQALRKGLFRNNGIFQVWADGEADSDFAIINGKKNLLFRVGKTGAFMLYDSTNQKSILSVNEDGTVNTFNGHSTKDLPLDGGGTVSAPTWKPVGIKNTGSPTCVFEFSGNSGLLGYLGFNNADNPVFVKADGSTVLPLIHTGNMADHVVTRNGGGVINGGLEIQKSDDITFSIKNTKSGSPTALIGFVDGKGIVSALGFSDGKPWVSGMGEIHHDGNSAKVHIGASAPSDTSALWIDTNA